MAGNWFERFCRNAGLALHRVAKPARGDKKTREVKREVEEHETEEGVTLRRTTIEEVEYRNKDE